MKKNIFILIALICRGEVQLWGSKLVEKAFIAIMLMGSDQEDARGALHTVQPRPASLK